MLLVILTFPGATAPQWELVASDANSYNDSEDADCSAGGVVQEYYRDGCCGNHGASDDSGGADHY